jgi:hypothetical protein
MFNQNIFLIFKKPTHGNILENTAVRSECHHDKLKSHTKIILCKTFNPSYNCLFINQNYIMLFLIKKCYHHKTCIRFKDPLPYEGSKTLQRVVFVLAPSHFHTTDSKELRTVRGM